MQNKLCMVIYQFAIINKSPARLHYNQFIVPVTNFIRAQATNTKSEHGSS